MALLGHADVVVATMILLFLSARTGVWTGTARPILFVFVAWVTLETGIVTAIASAIGAVI